MTDGAHPLATPQLRIPFAQIEPASLEAFIDAELAAAQSRIDDIASQEAPPTLANTLLALDEATEVLEYAMGIIGHLESVRTGDEIRAAYDAIQPKVSAFYAGIPLNAALYDRLRSFAESAEGSASRNDAPTKARWLAKTLDSFKRHGAELDQAGKERLAALEVELAQVTTRFSQSVVDVTAAYELYIDDEAKLAGLPESAKEAAAAAAAARDRSGWRFTLQAPSIFPVLRYLDDADIRETLWREYGTRASSGEHDNRERISAILSLRKEKAGLLGYADFSDLVLEDRMAKAGHKAWEFVTDLRERSQEAFEAENADLRAYRLEVEGQDAPPLAPWDVGYYAEKLRQARFDFDEELLRPYFPLESVLSGMFQLAERLYGVSVRAADDLPSWHEDARTYGIWSEDEHFYGYFHADLHPRDDKRGGAWMNALLTGKATDEPGRLTPHVGLICGNLNEPLGDKPALLTHREVETLFHEFGHLLHHMLTKVEVRSLAGTNVAWDFVELPSQIMENWCWERESLDLFARHHESGETIPDALFDKMLRARTFRAASAMMRQLSFSHVDLGLHREYSAETHGEVTDYAREVMNQFSTAELPEDYAMICSFGHLFSSPVAYAAGYYSYKWAEVLDADAFSVFKKEGIFSREAGTRFLDTLLSQGDAEDPMELFVRFVGRKPDLQALLRRSGLAKSNEASA
jgi:oligopeptidase A